jgi:Reverse transcriptase (RNA-dependent DNA polymerase)
VEGDRTYLGRSVACHGIVTAGGEIHSDRATEVSSGHISRESDEGPNSRERQVGCITIPTVLDRFIQHSHGFRPKRSAHQAVAKAQQYIATGNHWVVDLDLEEFFDRVNHDKRMAAIARRVTDKRVLQLIGAFLKVGVLDNGLVSPAEEGTLQGGSLSPLYRTSYWTNSTANWSGVNITSYGMRMTATSTSAAIERDSG